MDLVKGQNTIIDESLAYQLTIDAQGWEVGVVLGKKDNHRVFNTESGLSLSADSLFINISDIEPSITSIIVYAKRSPSSSASIDCRLISSLTSELVARCMSGTIETSLNAIELVHLYKIKDKWKIKSFYQGYSAGEKGLLSSHGIQMPSQDGSPKQHTATFSKLDFTLNWNPACSETFSTSQAYVDNTAPSISTLNLSCLYVLKSGQRGLIHGENEGEDRGSDHGIPFAKITNNYDAGKCSLVFNTEYVHKMFKYVVCAEISDGSRCWDDLNASLECSTNGAQETQLINSPLHTPVYVYALLEIVNGELKTKIINQYFTNYKEVVSVTGLPNA